MSIYIASSWRNQFYGTLLASVRDAGFPAYDFKNDASAFNWRDAVPLHERVSGTDGKPQWRPGVALDAIRSPVASVGFEADFRVLDEAAAVILCLPAGSSAHLEAGYARGAGVPVLLYVPESLEVLEPELMWRMFPPPVRGIPEVLAWLRRLPSVGTGCRICRRNLPARDRRSTSP